MECGVHSASGLVLCGRRRRCCCRQQECCHVFTTNPTFFLNALKGCTSSRACSRRTPHMTTRRWFSSKLSAPVLADVRVAQRQPRSSVFSKTSNNRKNRQKKHSLNHQTAWRRHLCSTRLRSFLTSVSKTCAFGLSLPPESVKNVFREIKTLTFVLEVQIVGKRRARSDMCNLLALVGNVHSTKYAKIA